MKSSVVALLVGTSGCVELTAPHPRMEFEVDAPYAAPFPSEHLRRPDGTFDTRQVSSRPNGIASQLRTLAGTLRGFGTTSAWHLAFDAPLMPGQLPAGPTRSPADLVRLVVVDPSSPYDGEQAWVELAFEADAGPFSTANVLTVLPMQGVPLRPATRYALVVERGLSSADGRIFGTSPGLEAIRRGVAPGMSAQALMAYQDTLASLEARGVSTSDLIALAVAETADPLEELARAAAQPHRALVFEPQVQRDTYDDYCSFESATAMPVFQEGTPPFGSSGGAWVWRDGALVEQRRERARAWITIPRTPMPEGGYPVVLFVRTGAGGDRPLLDRGVHSVAGGPSAPGTGLATEFARAGWAAIQVEGPHGGSRNVSGGDEQFLVFNIANPTALRDNLRQSALELILVARALEGVSIDASACPGAAAEATLATDGIVLFGHSMGASIGPLAVAHEPRFGAMILSGAGGSWLANILHKERPLATRPIAEALLGYGRGGLDAFDPVLSLLQWAGEGADAVSVGRPIVASSVDVLMFQGVFDRYIPTPVAAPLAMALGVVPVGTEIATSEPGDDLDSRLRRLGIERAPLPHAPPSGMPVRALVQVPEDGLEDGHEAVWQQPSARRTIECFLRDHRAGRRRVVAGTGSCPE